MLIVTILIIFRLLFMTGIALIEFNTILVQNSKTVVFSLATSLSTDIQSTAFTS